MAIETEIKFKVSDLPGLARRLEAAGFTLQTPRSFESNVLYDTPGREMRARTEILRIRNYAGRWTVTHKRVPDDGVGEDRHKHRVETETEVADGAALEQVFLELEGPAEWIDRAAARLGIGPADYITLSYGRMFDQWREQHRSDATDLTFAAVSGTA